MTELYVEYQIKPQGWVVVDAYGHVLEGPYRDKNLALKAMRGRLTETAPRFEPGSLKVYRGPTVENVSSNPIDEAIDELRKVLVTKRADYANGEDPFSNFSSAAEVAGITTRESIMSQIGIKLARLKNLESQDGPPKNEPIVDSALDLAGYAIILYAYYRSQK